MYKYLSRREQEKKEKGKIDHSLDEVWFYKVADAVAAWETAKRMWFYKRVDLPSLPLGCLVVRLYQHDMQFISGMQPPSLDSHSLCPTDVAEKLERLYRTQYITGLLDLQHLGKYQSDGAITTRFTRSCFDPIKEACQETGIWDDGGYYAQV